MAAIKNVRIDIDTSSLDALSKQLGGLERAVNAQNAIWRRVCNRVTPLVRRLVSQSLSRSDLHKRSGELASAVAQLVVYPTGKGLRIGLPRNRGKDFYAKAGALQYGAVHRAESSNTKTRRKLKQASNTRLSSAAYYDSTIKSENGPGGTFTVRAHPYFSLDSGQVKQVEAEVGKLLTEEIEAEARKA